MSVPKQNPERKIRDLTRSSPDIDDIEPVLLEITRAPDRSAALIAGSVADISLLDFIELHFERDDKNLRKSLSGVNGPLSTFSGKIDIAYAFGFISSNVRTNLHIVRAVRNVFAHSVLPLDFTEPALARECEKLVDLDKSDLPFSFERRDWEEWSAPRKAYCYAAIKCTISFLHAAISKLQSEIDEAKEKIQKSEREIKRLRKEINKDEIQDEISPE